MLRRQVLQSYMSKNTKEETQQVEECSHYKKRLLCFVLFMCIVIYCVSIFAMPNLL